MGNLLLRLVTVAVFLSVFLAVEVRSHKESLYTTMEHHTNCLGDRFMMINTNNCTHIANRSQCEARCDGSSTLSPLTRFKVIGRGKTMTGRKVCIKFIQKSGIQYVLKINRKRPVQLVFENQSRNTAYDSDSLFVEKYVDGTTRSTRIYEHTINDEVMCLTRRCDGSLSLISTSSNLKDRKCYFEPQY